MVGHTVAPAEFAADAQAVFVTDPLSTSS